MSDIQREKPTVPSEESYNPLLGEAYSGCAATIAKFEAKDRQATVAIYGAIVGGIEDIPNEIKNHPWETVGKVAVAGATGAAFAAAAAAESPIIANGAVLVGAATLGTSLWNSYTRLANDEKLKQAMSAVYRSGDLPTMINGMRVASDVIGPEAFNYGIATIGMRGGIHGPKAWSNLCENYFENRLVPFIPMAEITPFRAVEMPLSNCSSLHIHGKQAIFRIAGDEWTLDVYDGLRAGIDLRGSFYGRQVLRGSFGPTSPVKVDIDPRIGITKVVHGDRVTEYKHSELENRTLPTFLVVCEECRPFRKAMREAARLSSD